MLAPPDLVQALVLAAALEMVWSSMYAPLAATNLHSGASQILTLLTALVAFGVWQMGSTAAAVQLACTLVLIHGAMCLVMLVSLNGHRGGLFGDRQVQH